MRCYFLDIHIKSFFKEHRTTASTKPRTDAILIAKSCGFHSVILYYWETTNRFILEKHPLFPNRLLRIQLRLFEWLVRDSVIMVQLPFLRTNMYDELSAIQKHNKLIILVHDVEAIRKTMDGQCDLRAIQLADVIIVHSREMAGALVKLGINKNIAILGFFDYLCPLNRIVKVNVEDPIVVFAGNLFKSRFLDSLGSVENIGNMKMNLYGLKSDVVFPDWVTYKGYFDNEEISAVEGNWGLVWDGDSVETCNGTLGAYLKYNAPFKFSLYLALGIPVIVWEESALSKYVKEYHLGICVSSLSDIQITLSSLDAMELTQIRRGVEMYANKVRTGQMLTKAITKSLVMINEKESYCSK